MTTDQWSDLLFDLVNTEPAGTRIQRDVIAEYMSDVEDRLLRLETKMAELTK